MVIIVSDNESWADQVHGHKSALLAEWDTLKRRCPQAKLVCIDIQPYVTTPAKNRADILNIGGFSDHVFTLLGDFATHNSGDDHWVRNIEAIELLREAA